MVTYTIKLQIPGGGATPGPPVGPALGSKGVKAIEFCNQFNAKTQHKRGELLPVVINIHADKRFDFIIKSPPASALIKKAAKIEKGSGVPNRDRVGTISQQQVKEIAQAKWEDLHTFTMESAMKLIAGTARSMGVEVVP